MSLINKVSTSAILRFAVLLTIALPVITSHTQAQGIIFNGVTPNQTTVAKWDKYEATIQLTASYTNQYDYNDIAVQATFTSPTGIQRTIDAFWMEDYIINHSTGDLTSAGTPGFRLRFTPDEPGQWSYVLSGRLQGGSPTTSPVYTFTCAGISATGKGYIRKTNSNYLKWDNGSQYIPVGENIAYPYANIVPYYDTLLTELEPTGVNILRVWMATWGVGLEWTNGTGLFGFNGLKQYKQTAAKVLDYWLERGKTNGYAIMLSINYHDQFMRSKQWHENPYNGSLGGPCSNPDDFFTNTLAKDVFKNRLRYLVARWGYSGNLQSWELFNEVDQVDEYSSHVTQVDQWHHEMAGYLKSIDPNHLVTTSFGEDANGYGTWSSANIDFTQTHKYKLDPNLQRLLSNLNQRQINTFSKPTINGEFGLSINESAEVPYDPSGITMHNAMWATLCSGAMGSAMVWLWEGWVDRQDLYGHFSRLSAFKDAVPFEAGNYKPVADTYLNTMPADVSVVPQGQWGDTIRSAIDFTLDNEGALTPGTDSLNVFIYGSAANTQYRRPPVFHVNYLQNGSFILVTDTVRPDARITIYVDGVMKLNELAQVRGTYTVAVDAGSHTIKVDNLGGDWAAVASYRFVNAVGPLNTYLLKNAGNSGVAGYVLYRLYNYQYRLDNNNNAPPVVPAGALLKVPGMNNGTYTIHFYSCAPAPTAAPAQPISSITAVATNGILTFSLPAVAWDIAFTATSNNNPPAALTTGVTVSPILGWADTTSSRNFIVDNSGIVPGASRLSTLVYGSLANTQYRNPPTFIANYGQSGYFSIRTDATISQSSPRVTIYVDGVKMLDEPALVNTSYTVTIPPGLHSIMVDNLGGDWFMVNNFVFDVFSP